MSGHDHNAAGASHGNFKQYTVGFIPSVSHHHPIRDGDGRRILLITVIAITAVCSGNPQLVYFLHMNTSSEQRWNLIAFIYTILCIMVLLVGSVGYELPTLQHDDLN